MAVLELGGGVEDLVHGEALNLTGEALGRVVLHDPTLCQEIALAVAEGVVLDQPRWRAVSGDRGHGGGWVGQHYLCPGFGFGFAILEG